MNSSEYLLQVRNLKIYYYTYEGVVKAVDGVSFNIKRGEALGIAGESGCGKSTLAYGLLRIVPIPGKIVGGKVIFDGTDILQLPESEFKRKYRWKRISMVFQGAMNSLDPVKNIGKQIADVILTHEENISKSEAYKRANELLKLVGIDPARAKSYPHELSGGMKQRVVIAMALALNPDLLIADEPTTALDV
ncbi:MAG: dipeptide/oligopeptide/nickel ABC transporter ATP-binding protein, partial [Desulfurococcales archaeon ex4484_42]